MSVICIGGICIPYTAIIPILLLGLRWLAEKLARLGLLPESVVQHLGIHVTNNKTTEKEEEEESCCQSNKRSITKPTKLVHSVESMQDWRSLKEEHDVLVVKFTATWCRPCQEVAPVFADLSQEYENTRFVQVDVDDLDEVASEHNVAIMPTFVCIKRGREISSMRGSNPQNLTSFVKQHVSNEQE